MSLVLEALKKAEAERERERAGVPGLHTAAPLPPAGASGSGGWLPWTVAGSALALAAALLAWRLWPATPPVVVVAAAPPAAAPAPAPASLPPSAARPEAEAPAAAASAPAPAPRTAPSRVTAADAARSRTGTEEAPSRAARQSAPTAAPRPPAAADAARAEAAVYDGVQALPEGLRRALPPLQFGGAMDSDNAASRMLIVNGQVFRENDALAPDLVLERIALKSAVFRFRDVRFRVRY